MQEQFTLVGIGGINKLETVDFWQIFKGTGIITSFSCIILLLVCYNNFVQLIAKMISDLTDSLL